MDPLPEKYSTQGNVHRDLCKECIIQQPGPMEVCKMNCVARKNHITTTVSLRSLRLKWSFKIMLNEKAKPRCLVISTF